MDGLAYGQTIEWLVNRWTVLTFLPLFFDVVFSSSDDDTDIAGNNVCV